jgi:hypothetical protein
VTPRHRRAPGDVPAAICPVCLSAFPARGACRFCAWESGGDLDTARRGYDLRTELRARPVREEPDPARDGRTLPTPETTDLPDLPHFPHLPGLPGLPGLPDLPPPRDGGDGRTGPERDAWRDIRAEDARARALAPGGADQVLVALAAGEFDRVWFVELSRHGAAAVRVDRDPAGAVRIPDAAEPRSPWPELLLHPDWLPAAKDTGDYVLAGGVGTVDGTGWHGRPAPVDPLFGRALGAWTGRWAGRWRQERTTPGEGSAWILVSRDPHWRICAQAARHLSAEYPPSATLVPDGTVPLDRLVDDLVGGIPTRHTYALVAVEADTANRTTRVITRELFPRGTLALPGSTPSTSVALAFPASGNGADTPTERLLHVVDPYGGPDGDWPVLMAGAYPAPGGAHEITVRLVDARRLEVGIDHDGTTRALTAVLPGAPPGTLPGHGTDQGTGTGNGTGNGNGNGDGRGPTGTARFGAGTRRVLGGGLDADIVCAVELADEDPERVRRRIDFAAELAERLTRLDDGAGRFRLALAGYTDHDPRRRVRRPDVFGLGTHVPPLRTVPFADPADHLDVLAAWEPAAVLHHYAAPLEEVVHHLDTHRTDPAWRWRAATRLLVTVGSRPPHPLARGADLVMPCPERLDWRTHLAALRSRDGLRCVLVDDRHTEPDRRNRSSWVWEFGSFREEFGADGHFGPDDPQVWAALLTGPTPASAPVLPLLVDTASRTLPFRGGGSPR